MSLLVFDDSKIDEIKKRNEQGSEEQSFDVVEASKEAKGGSELVYARVKERVPKMSGITFKSYFQESVH